MNFTAEQREALVCVVRLATQIKNVRSPNDRAWLANLTRDLRRHLDRRDP